MSIVHEKKKAFTLINEGKTSFFNYHLRFLLTNHKYRKNKNDFFVELKRMLHPRVFSVKNCMTWCQSMVTLCLVFNLVSRSFLVLV